jgi:hypothetical protein
MLHLSTEELCVISISLEEEENIQNSEKRKRKRFSVHEMLNKRKTEGEYWSLYKEKFFQYFRLSQYKFNELLEKIKVVITVNHTKMNTPVLIQSIFHCPRWKCTWMCMNTTENSFILYVCFHCCPARHVQTRTMSDKSHTETDRAESCRKRLKLMI